MLLAESLLGSSSAVAANYIEDVFSTYLYTGNSSTQTITNGIDLSGQGGLVWIKGRSGSTAHALYDTVRGATFDLATNTASGQTIQTTGLTAFNSTGFDIDALSKINNNAAIYGAWTFREQSRFFDIVTYTGNGANRTIAHNLGSVPGCIIVKRTDTIANWQVYHRSLANTQYTVLNRTDAAATGTTRWNSTTPTNTVFSLGTDATVNANGGTYVAYLFAHDAGGFGATSADNVITCGTFTLPSPSGTATVTLGYEPQWVMYKNATAPGSWIILDNTRGWGAGIASSATLAAEDTGAEGGGAISGLNATGFSVNNPSGLSGDYIYIAVRRGPMRTPTTGTSVFNPVVYTGTNVDNRLVNTSIAPDMVLVRQRDDAVLSGMVNGDRLRPLSYQLTGSTAAELAVANAFDRQLVVATEYGNSFSAMNGFWCGNDATAKLNVNTASNNHVAEAFRRAPGFFDAVCYTGTGSATTVTHNLGVVPELMIVKNRGAGGAWQVYPGVASEYLVLNTTAARVTGNTDRWNNTTPTASVFSVGTATVVNAAGNTYVAYLFATCAGVSKVGTYTGTGATLVVNCGFTSGARFVLIKRTDGSGNWYVWDTARGIVAGNDPYLLLSSTAAEVTSTDYIDTYSAGFEISSTAPAAINANGGTFIFLAIA